MRILYLMWVALLLSSQAWAQEKTVTGTVSAAEDGSVIPGANVVLKGTTTGVSTDVNGNYTIQVPNNDAMLQYTFVGRTTKEETVGERTVISVGLANTTLEQEEVVVTGVAISREKRSLGYGVQSIGGDQIISSREGNVVNALNSKVAGVQVISSAGTPGASASIRIRGTNSISGDYQPLFVIDGIPIDNSEVASAQERDANVPFTQGVNNSNRAVDINPQDVENVTVLKGPAAAAIYGIRAANGAVIITTKKGKSTPGGKLNITYSSRFAVDEVNKLPKFQNKYSQGLNGEYAGPETGQSASWGALEDTLVYQKDPSYAFDKNGQIVSKNQNPGGSPINKYNNVKDFFIPGYTFDNNLAVSGGSEKSTFYASINRYAQSGIIPNTDFKKTSVRFTASTKVTQKLELTGSLNYINSGGRRAQQGSNTSGIMLGLLRTPNSFDNSNGFDQPWKSPEAYLLPDGRQRSYRANPRGATYDNPYFTVARNLTRDDVDRFISYAQAKYSFTDYFFATYRLGLDQYSDTRRGGYDIRSSAYPEGRAFEDRITNRIINQDVILSFRKRFGDFDITANGGHNLYSTKFGKVYTQVDNLGVTNLLSLSNGTSIYGFQTNTQILRFGVYGDVNVGFRDRYYLGLTVRNDWSSTLPAKNNSFLYPAVSFGYVFSEDLKSIGLLSENSFINFAKLRASAAQVGRDATPLSVNTVYGQGAFSDGYTSGILFPYNNQNGYSYATTAGSTQPVLGNPNLKPETNRTYETGLEMQFFNNRASFDFNLYFADNRDQIVLAPVPSSSGVQYQTVNTGRLQNKGIEITANINPVRTTNFRWDFTLNYTKNVSLVKSLAKGVDVLFLNGFTGSGAYAIPGQPFSVFYGTAFARSADGKFVIGNDGKPLVDGAPHILANPNPKYLINIRNRFEFYNFFVNTLLDIRVGGQIWNGTRGGLNFFGRGIETESRGDTAYYDGYRADASGNATAERVVGKVVRDQSWFRGNGSSFAGPSDESIETVNWVRLRELTFGYTFTQNAIKKVGFQSLQLSVYARNLFLITGYKGVDPETSLTGTSNGFGLDYFNNPNTRTYGGTLTLSF